MAPTELHTERLVLRAWRPEDREPFAALNADPVVMEHFPRTLTEAESDAFADRIAAHIDEHGWGLWAVEVLGVTSFAGYTGLWPPAYSVPGKVEPGAVEVGWRLAHEHWGRGYAPEAGHAALWFGFSRLGLAEIVSFTVPQNSNSRRVMDKIGLRHRPERDFGHPQVDPVLHPRSVRHVLYATDRAEWEIGGNPVPLERPATHR